MAISLVSPPAIPAISLAEVKSWLRLETGLDDELVANLSLSATCEVERMTGLRMIAQTWRQYVDPARYQRLPSGLVAIELQCAPMIRIAALRGYDAEGHAHELDPASTTLIANASPPRLLVSPSILAMKSGNGLEIDMVCGHGEMSTDIPATLRHAILVLIAHWYEFRGAVDPGDQPVSFPRGFEALIANCRRVRL